MPKLSIYKQNKLFFNGYFLFFFLSVFLLIYYTKAEGFYLMNVYHSNFLTWVFIYATYLGDGLFCIAIGILLFLFRRRFLGLMVISSYALSGIVAQIIKYFILEPRPAILFKDSGYPYFIDDVTLHNLHSFPSGHTSSAFAMAAVLAFGIKNKNYSLLLLAGAVVVGYSRIYLAQHFLNDVLAGSFIGVVSAIICYIFLFHLFSRLDKRRLI